MMAAIKAIRDRTEYCFSTAVLGGDEIISLLPAVQLR